MSLASHVSRLSQKALIKNGQIFSRPPPHFPSFSFFRQKGAPRPSPPPSGGGPRGPPGGPPSGGPPFVKKEQFLPRGVRLLSHFLSPLRASSRPRALYASDARSLVETRLLRTHAGTHDE